MQRTRRENFWITISLFKFDATVDVTFNGTGEDYQGMTLYVEWRPEMKLWVLGKPRRLGFYPSKITLVQWGGPDNPWEKTEKVYKEFHVKEVERGRGIEVITL